MTEVTTESKKVPDTWDEMVKPMVAKFKVAYALNKKTTFKPSGCKAMAELLQSMANRLDKEVFIRETLLTGSDLDFETYIAALRHNRKKRLDNLS